MAALSPSIVVKMDPEAVETFRGLAGRIDKLIEIVERMEKRAPNPSLPPSGALPYYVPGPDGKPVLVFPESSYLL